MTTDWPVPDGAARVLVVDDDPLFSRLVAHLLEDAGYMCSTASDGEDAVSIATAEVPDLVLLDVAMPGLSGTETLALLRADHRTALTPVVFVTGSSDSATKVRCLMSGADDYLTKPFETAELIARVHLAIRRHRLLRDISPLTYLPGNAAIHREMARRVGAGQPFSVLWIDIDHFKAYNDRYGFSRGDLVIKATARALKHALDAHPSLDSFAGHVGGDDFVALTDPDLAETVAREVISRFDSLVAGFYDATDHEQGWIETFDRSGTPHRFPLASVSIGIATSVRHPEEPPASLSALAAEMKALAKTAPGSSWATDRRSVVPASSAAAAS